MHNDSILCLLFESNGIILYSGLKDKTIKVWNTEINTLIATLEGHDDWVTCLAFNNNETLLFSCSWDGKIIVWDV